MAVFHFLFDLDHFRFINQNFLGDPVWTGQRTAIVSLFLFCAGVSQAVAFEQGVTPSRFWRRWAQVAGCALLVTLASYAMFPRSFIYFGVLHALAVMLPITRAMGRLGRGFWIAGAVALILPWLVSHPFFDGRATNWIGLATRKPVTEDYVPLLPWIGVMWCGFAAGQWLLAHRRGWLTGPLWPALRPLAVLGRWSLSFYMVHQPVLIAIVAGLAHLYPRAG